MAKVVLDYSEDDGCSFQSYMSSIDIVNIIENDDYLDMLAHNKKVVARFLSERIQCSCIPTTLSCDHGFSPPPKGDPIWTFLAYYTEALHDEVEQRVEIARANSTGLNYSVIQANAATLVEKEGLSHLWDSEEKR